MTTSLRTRVGAQLDTALRNMQRETDKHDPRALAERAALRQGLQGGFGTAPLADAAVLRILRLPAGEDGEPPAMTPQLQALLEDAVLVASLVAATRVGVR